MRATLNIPDELITEVQNITGARSKTKAVVTAIQELVGKNGWSSFLLSKAESR